MAQVKRSTFQTNKDALLPDNTNEEISPQDHRDVLDESSDSSVFLSDEWTYALINPAPVRVATTANGTFSTAFANGQTIDGTVLATGDRILLKNQLDVSQNGIYLAPASGSPTRAGDFNSVATNTPAVRLGAKVYVEEGTANAKRTFTLTTASADPIVIDTTDLTFEELGTGGAALSGERNSNTTITISEKNTVFTAASAITVTLPAGSESNIWEKYYIANDGTANATISGDGSDSISGSDPWVMYAGTRAIFMWDGVNWVIWG